MSGMSTQLQSAVPNDSATCSDAANDCERRDTPRCNTYGAEDLPVLIRLPDLTAATQIAAAAIRASTPVTPMHEAQPPATEKAIERAARPQRGSRTRNMRRKMSRNVSAGWLRNVVQLAFAAVLALILLAIVVTIKQWNQEAPAPKRSPGYDRVDAPNIDFGQPSLAPPSNLISEKEDEPLWEPVTSSRRTLQGVVPADLMPSEAAAEPAGEQLGTPVPAAGPVHVAGPTQPPGGRGYADAAERPTSPHNYPTTGVEPVANAPRLPRVPQSAGWRETVPLGPIRNAERGAADSRSQPR
jgi:hypothetical protein